MANREKLRIKSALKRAKQNIKRNALKSSQRALTRTAVKAVKTAIDSGDKQSASEAFKKAEKVLDTMANKKIIHANKASRTKSRPSKRIKSL
ncbi:MAG: 30S ribosomal protein S20 [Gammaproteobacteria bacterium]|nr:MAG: 30S ribosomal protein S20 [Gammaproteobacteria bacterium]